MDFRKVDHFRITSTSHNVYYVIFEDAILYVILILNRFQRKLI